MTARPRPPSTLKTYSRLAREKRMPTDYEVVTTDLLYYVERGFEVETPLQEWYAKHQAGSPLVSKNWDGFVDPRETTYAKYTDLAQGREAYVDGILQSIERSGYDEALTADWRAKLDAVLGPLRFPLHGLQMIAAYVGQMAPSGRIAVAAAFQVADELRRVQRIAYRMAQLRLVDPSFGSSARETWQNGAAWQPLRKTIEYALVTYDWAEALVALNLCIKPVVDELFMVRLPRLAKRHDDFLLGQIFGSLDEDCRWHRDWTAALFGMVIGDDERNRAVIDGWTRKWASPALEAAAALEEFSDGTGAPLADALEHLFARIGVGARRP